MKLGSFSQKATPEMVAEARPPEGFESILSSSPFGWENGPIFEKITEDKIMRGFRVAPRHLNAGGMVHGGMVMTFADILLATAAHSVASPPMVTVRVTTDFIGPAVEGEWVQGYAEAEAPVDGMIPVRGLIEAAGRPVASVQGLFKALVRGTK